MKKSFMNRPLWHGLRRIIAIVLAFSMILIPVHFPGRANAVGASTGSNGNIVLPQNYFQDDFASDKYLNGVTYQWDFTRTGQSYIRDGKYYLDPDLATGGYVYYNYSLLKATTTDPETKTTTDVAATWKNYTVEADVTRLDNTNNVQGGIMGRVSLDPATGKICYYTFVVRDADALLYKSYVDSTGAYKQNQLLGRPSGKAPKNTTVRTAMEFSGNTIYCYVNDALVYTYVDDGTYGAPLTSGTVGMYVTPNNALVSYDNFRVSYTPESTAFFDDFSDERYVDGYTYGWVNEPGPEQPKYDVDYKWGKFSSSSVEGAVSEGRYEIQTPLSASPNYVYMKAVTVDDADPFDSWSNYTVEADVQRVNADEGGDTGMYLLGRVNGDGSFYALQYYGEISLWRFSGGLAQTEPTGFRFKNVGFVGRGYDGQIHMSMSFSGNEITVHAVAKDETGAVIKEESFSVTDSTYTTGGIGLLTKGSSSDLGPDRIEDGKELEGGVIAPADKDGPWTGYWDNIKVTLEDGTVVLNETFNAENNSMDADGMTVQAVYEIPQVVEEHWSVNGGVISTPVPEIPQDVTYTWTKSFTGNTTSAVSLKESSTDDYSYVVTLPDANRSKDYIILNATTEDGTDFDQTWEDYTVEMDVCRANFSGNADRLFLLGRMSDDGNGYGVVYYGSGGFSFWKIVNYVPTRILDAGGANADWVHIKLSFKGKTITTTLTYEDAVKGEQTIEKIYSDEAYEKKGTVGVLMQTDSNSTSPLKIHIDNFKVTLDDGTADGTVVFEDSFNSTDNSMDSDGLVMKRVYTPPVVEEEGEGESEPVYTYAWQVGTGSELTGSVVSEDSNNWFAVETAISSGQQYWSYLKLLDEEDVDTAANWTDYTIAADVKRERASERDTALALVGRLNIETGGCYVLSYNGETVKLYSYTGYHTDNGLYAKNDYRKLVQYSADKWRDCSLGTGLSSATDTTVHIYMTFSGNDITYGYSYVLDGMTYSNSNTVTVSTTCTNHCDTETEIDADLDATCTVPVHTKGNAGILIQGFYQDWGPDCKNDTTDDADGAGVYYVDNYSVVMNNEEVYFEDYEPEQPEDEEEEETLVDKKLIKLLDIIPKINARDHKMPSLFEDWGNSGGVYTVHNDTVYKWSVPGDSMQSYSVEDGKLNVQTQIGNKVFYSYLVKADGSMAGENWTNYTVTADVTRTNGNESASTYLIGRVQEDGTFYALDYYGSDINLYKHYGGRTLSGENRHRLLNAGTGLGRDYEGTVTLSMKFEGNVITVGIAYTDANGDPCSKTYSYTDNEDCADHLGDMTGECFEAPTYGGVGMLVQSWYADLDEDGPFASSFDNITVTDLNGNILFQEDFTSASIWADYGVETDFRLDSSHSTAGIILRYTAAGYYELRMSSDKVALYYVTGEAETLLKEQDFAISKEAWHFVRVAVKTTTLTCYIDGDPVLSCDNLTALTKGTVGLSSINGVSYDNFALYPIDNLNYRGNATYLFEGESAAELESNWVFDNVESWSAENGILRYAGSGNGFASLRRKNVLENFYAEILATPKTADATFGVCGRVSEDLDDYYMLTLNVNDGIVLSKYVDGNSVVSIPVNIDKLYAKGILLVPNTQYALRLSMHDNVVEAYLDGQRVISYQDPAVDYFRSGVSAIRASAGVDIYSLTVGESTAPVKLTIVDKNGNALDLVSEPMQVAAGKIPDIKQLYVNVDNGTGEIKTVPLDTLPLTNEDGTAHVFDYALTVDTTKTVIATYDEQTVSFRYTIVDRSEMIEDIDAALTALNVSDIAAWDLSGIADTHQIYENLTAGQQERVKEIYALADRYDDLSAVEKARITAGNPEKLANALKLIEETLYPMIKNAPVIWEDNFDNSYSGGNFDDQYTHDQYITNARNNGYWFLENGTMFQYSEDDTVDGDNSFEGGAMINNKKYSVTSVSGDVQIVSDLSWVGIYANAMPGGEYYRLAITDKDLNTGDRVVLTKGIYALAPTVYLDKNFFEVGQWYNLRLTIEDGWIRGYVDDVLYFEVLDEPNLIYDLFEEGTAGFWSAEGWGSFDNLTVRGEVLDDNFDGRPQFNENLVAGSYKDDFDDVAEETGKNPSHWIEVNTQDKWKLEDETVGNNANVYYALSGNLTSESHTWLHVLETDVDYTVSLRIPTADRGHFPIIGLTTRLNTTDSYIKSGYDFYLQKWFIKYRLGTDFEEVTAYSEKDTAVDFADWVAVRVVTLEDAVTLYKGDTQILSTNVGTKVGPGRVGVFAERCNVDVDNVLLTLTSGQSHVQDGVLEYYSKSFGFESGLHQYIEVPNKDDPNGDPWLLAYGAGVAISKDGGQTFTKTGDYSKWILDSSIKLSKEGYYLTVRSASNKNEAGNTVTTFTSYLSTDYGETWIPTSTLPTDPNVHYSQPARTMNEVKLPNGGTRLFFTANNNSHGTDRGTVEGGLSETYYTDDYGYTWYKSKNGLNETSGIGCFTETMVIQRSDGVLVHLSSYTSAGCIRYSLSHDYGETWEGDYALPQFVSPRGSIAIVKDPYETEDVWYMTVVYNHGYSKIAGNPRNRIALFRSYDGINWYFLCDVDRWEQTGDGGRNQLLHSTNMYLTVTEDYVLPTSARSEEYRRGNNANFGIVWRFEKSKLVDKPMPAEYLIDNHAVTFIEAVPAEKNLSVTLNSELPIAGNQIKINYYNADSTYVPMEDAFVSVTTNALGEQTVTVDYKQFRCLYTVNVIAGDAPVISGVENGKTYCGAQEVTVTDANGDLASVTLNGNAVSLTDGKFTVSAAEGQQTIVATDKAGNATTITVTVNADHTWSATWTTENEQHWKECTVDGCEATTTKTDCSGGEADCQNKAVCATCEKEYGEKSTTHKWATEWTTDGTNHWHKCETAGCNEIKDEAGHTPAQDDGDCTTAIKCTVCQKVTTEAKANHTPAQDDGDCTTAIRCTVCQKVTTAAKESHTGGTATCKDKAECTVCGKEYGALAAHKGGTATCTDKAKCDVCGEAYGELNADKHTKEAKWATTADKHSKVYECCGKVVVAEEAHEWKDSKCEECGYEAAPGTEQKPIEIPADKETVKEEAKVEADEEMHYELDEKLAGKVITVKGEGAYIIVDGKKYEAKNGIVEVKLPTKTGKISVVIGNAGTKAGTFSITIATPSEDNSDTGDNAATVLFGSLMALSVLAAGILLIPGIRKRLIK